MLALSRFHSPFEVVESILQVARRISIREGITNTPQAVVYDMIRTGLHHGDIPSTSMLTVLKVSPSLLAVIAG